MMKFKDLVAVIPSIEGIRLYERSGTNIIYRDFFKRYVDMDLYGERTVSEIRILGSVNIMVILKEE